MSSSTKPLGATRRFVFFPAVAVIALFLFFGAIFTEATRGTFDAIQTFIVTNFGWFYILSVAFFLFFVIALALSPYGKIRLGGDSDRPQYSNLTWFAMLFSAGMGIGLLFYGVAEPLLHYANPPRVEPLSVEAARRSMNLTFYHWGLHAWSIYIVVGLSLAYFAYRKGLPLSIRSAFFPFLGERINGPLGDLVDTLAIFGTMFGVATSLGLGVMQINAGLNYVLGLSVSTGNQLILIAIITLIATASVALGLDRGIRRLSEINIVLAILLMLFVFAVGPTVFILNAFVQNTGFYLQNIIETTFWLDTYYATGWQAGWTLFYWGWWIAWSPFVGMFIARISRGRTIREFVTGVLLVPVAVTFLWLTIFGNTALYIELFGEGGLVDVEVNEALFAMLGQFPWAQLSSVLAIILVVTFFVTSSDSGSLVISILGSGGSLDAPVGHRVFWAVLEGAVASVLLLAGGLAALQTASITTALPFTVILVLMAFALLKAVRRDGLPEVDRNQTPVNAPEKGGG